MYVIKSTKVKSRCVRLRDRIQIGGEAASIVAVKLDDGEVLLSISGPTVEAELCLPDGADIEVLQNYWGSDGKHRQIAGVSQGSTGFPAESTVWERWSEPGAIWEVET